MAGVALFTKASDCEVTSHGHRIQIHSINRRNLRSVLACDCFQLVCFTHITT